MKTFILRLTMSLVFMLLLAELIVRVLGYAGHTVANSYLDGEYRLEPLAKGIWIKGTSAEIKSRYEVNRHGFNSIIDYSFNDTSKYKVALIGDSYIEGFHSSVDSSIGRRIEKHLLDNSIEVHEYGISGWNAWNYLEIANEINDNYQILYILITDKDLIAGKPSKATITGEPSTSRQIYNRSHFLRYMNINRGIIKSLKEIGPKRKVSTINSIVDSPDHTLLSLFPDNCIFVFEENKFLNVNKEITSIEINHILKPINFGKQDSHWNDNGRENCALTIANSIKELLHKEN